jgi:hypothetical protein
MKRILHKLSLLTVAIFLFTSSYAQNPAVIAIESQLTDIEGVFVPDTKVGISLLILNSSGESCYENDKTIETDDLGNLKMFIEDVPVLFADGTGSDPAVIQLTLTSPGNDSWLEEDIFEVKYLMTIEGSEANPEYTITRMEGQKLNYEYKSDIWKFQDIYPFAYIKSTFLVSFNKEIADAKSLLMVAHEFFEESAENYMEGDHMDAEEETAPSRGLKGGFAVGGLNQKEKAAAPTRGLKGSYAVGGLNQKEKDKKEEED